MKILTFFQTEFFTFFTSLQFYTRIPIPFSFPFSPSLLENSTRYFTWIGWIVGGLSALGYELFRTSFSHSISVFLVIVLGILLTGAFHEDGFIDTCDGIGGGWNREKILEIMKDSRIGAFGGVGLVLLLLGRYLVLFEINPNSLGVALLGGAIVSRFSTALVLRVGVYAKENEDSKAKPMGKTISLLGLLWSFVAVLICGVLFYQNAFLQLKGYALFGIPMVFGLGMYAYIRKWIGGYTGDNLGAIQQTTEFLFFLLFVAFNYTI